MRLSNKLYDVLKWLCLVCLPAVAVLYAALDGAFGWGYTKVVCTVIAAVETFIGSLIGVSTAAYNKEKNE